MRLGPGILFAPWTRGETSVQAAEAKSSGGFLVGQKYACTGTVAVIAAQAPHPITKAVVGLIGALFCNDVYTDSGRPTEAEQVKARLKGPGGTT